jgi:glycerophosphoryl diester phosphodiesterase
MKPWIIAHRGARDEAFENTRAAFDLALKYPIDGIELDVRMTKDSKVIVNHNPTLAGGQNFKSLRGSRKRISHNTYEELCAAFPEKPLLTLSETLRLYAHRTCLMIEIKSDKADRTIGRNLELAERVMKELEYPCITPYLHNIFILSFDADVLKFASQKIADLKYVLNLSDSDECPTGHTSVIGQPRTETEHLYALCVNLKYLSEELVAYAHDLQKKMMTYTCNTVKQVKKAVSLNTDVLMTDKPGWLTHHWNLSNSTNTKGLREYLNP